MERLVLWDIDYTLLYAGGLGRTVYADAFAAVTGRDAQHLPHIVGHTDHGLVRGMLTAHGIEPARDLVERFYLAVADASYRLRAQMLARGRVMPGVPEALAALAAVPGTVQTVATGNLRTTARLKVDLFGLGEHLDMTVGGYGCECGIRAELVRDARCRAAARYGVDLAADRVWVIGDTPDDVAGARAAGVRVVAVGTGPRGAEGMAALDADLYLPDLRDTRALVEAVCGLPDRAG